MENAKSAYNEVFDETLRYVSINRLRRELGLPETEPGNSETELPHPPIGIEVEMTWMQAFPELGQQWKGSTIRPSQLNGDSKEYQDFSEAYDKEDKRLHPVLEKTRSVIPSIGPDAYWEFSFLPSKNIDVTRAELELLYDAEILRDGETYATHMTIAGLDNDRDAFALLCGLELLGGSTSDRITAAVNSQKGAWARKGKGGLRKRHESELVGDDISAYELRTLTISSFEQASSLLNNGARLATMHASHPEEWKAYRAMIEGFLKDNGLTLTGWERPRQNSLPWLKYASLMDSTDVSFISQEGAYGYRR